MITDDELEPKLADVLWIKKKFIETIKCLWEDNGESSESFKQFVFGFYKMRLQGTEATADVAKLLRQCGIKADNANEIGAVILQDSHGLGLWEWLKVRFCGTATFFQ